VFICWACRPNTIETRKRKTRILFIVFVIGEF
jgi:hypothetical protein